MFHGGKQSRNLADEMKTEFKKALEGAAFVLKSKPEVIDRIKKYLPGSGQAAAVLKLINANWTNRDFKTNVANALTNYLNQHQTTQSAEIKFEPEDINSIFDNSSSSLTFSAAALTQLNTPVSDRILRNAELQKDFMQVKPFIGQPFILWNNYAGMQTATLCKLNNVNDESMEFTYQVDQHTAEHSIEINKGREELDLYPFPLNPNHKIELINKLIRREGMNRDFDPSQDLEYINGQCITGKIDPQAAYRVICVANQSYSPVGKFWLKGSPIFNLRDNVRNKIFYTSIEDQPNNRLNLENRHFILMRIQS